MRMNGRKKKRSREERKKERRRERKGSISAPCGRRMKECERMGDHTCSLRSQRLPWRVSKRGKNEMKNKERRRERKEEKGREFCNLVSSGPLVSTFSYLSLETSC